MDEGVVMDTSLPDRRGWKADRRGSTLCLIGWTWVERSACRSFHRTSSSWCFTSGVPFPTRPGALFTAKACKWGEKSEFRPNAGCTEKMTSLAM